MTNKFPDLLSKIIDETTGDALQNEVKHFREFAEKLNEIISEYRDKSLEILEQDSLSGFLFASYNYSARIKDILEEYIKEPDWNTYTKELENLNLKAFDLFDLGAGKDPEKNGNILRFSRTWQQGAKEFFKSMLRKKTTNERIIECYLYNILVYNTHQDHLNNLGKFEEIRNELLSSLREDCKIIDENIVVLSQNKYDLTVSKGQFKFAEDNKRDTKKILKKYGDASTALLQSLKVSLENAYKNFEKEKQHHLETIKKNRKKFTAENVKRASIKIETLVKNSRANWRNTSYALSDDWSLDLEINSLKYHILKEYFSFTGFFENRFNQILDEKINTIRINTEELLTFLQASADPAIENIVDKLNEVTTESRRKLVLRVLPSLKELIFNNEILKELNEFEESISLQIESLSTSCIILEDGLYDKAVESNQLKKISPYDLVSYDMEPKFMLVFPSLKGAVIRYLEELHGMLEEVPEIIDFSIESAIGYFEEKNDLEEALKVGRDGILRAINKIDDIDTFKGEFYTKEIEFLKDKIDELIQQINEITDNESVLQIKIRITKAKALEQSKAVRDNVIHKIKDILPLVFRKIQGFNSFLKASSLKIKKQFEIESGKGYISTDVSDFLTETEEAVNRLPFVYQRLFKPEPLSVFDLYIERGEPLERLKFAYSRWGSGKFAPTVLFGEKGSGKTTCINRFISMKNIPEEIVFHDLHQEALDPDAAYKMISDSAPYASDNLNNNQIIIRKKIIVIDGLERLFEARINGFEALHKTLKLISDTNHAVFWIVACHLYSYKYLEKSSNISDYFGYHIEMEDLTSEELTTIIEKRHNISGFRIKFLPDPQKKSGMLTQRPGDKSGEMDLKFEYFDRLQKVVKGNITQAFLYWMRSAAEVTDDVISMNMPGDSNLDFVQSISLSKYEILRIILIHNGVNSVKQARIFRIPIEKSELQLSQMFDDGLIIRYSGIYYINPMIYKQVIIQMYKLNLLH